MRSFISQSYLKVYGVRMSKWIWIVVMIDIFFSLGVREAKGEATRHTEVSRPQEESPSHPTALKLQPKVKVLSRSGREWYQGLDAHSKNHIEKLIWGNQEEARSSLSHLKKEKGFLNPDISSPHRTRK